MADSILNLLLLGPPLVHASEATFTSLLPAKARALLFYLVVTGRAHSREALAGLLWSDSPEGEARLSLRVALNALRQQLPDYVVATRQDIVFNSEQPYGLDVKIFDEALHSDFDRCRTREMEEALGLYRGDFLQDFHVKDAPLFEEWVVLERERLRLQALNAMQQLITRYLEERQYASGILLAQRALAIDPWREATHRQLMSLFAQSDRRNEALKQYETCRRILLEELSVEPASETQALYEQIRSGAVTTPLAGQDRSPLHNLPAITTPFIGREAELAHLATLLPRDDCRLITLVGPGGVGKSRLAVEFGWQCLMAAVLWAGDGIFFVSLAGVEAGECIVTALLNALSVSPIERDPKQQLLRHLRDQRLFFILDNFEQLMTSAVLLTDILHAAPQVRLIVTSREALQLSEEWLFDVSGLTIPIDEAAADSAETCDAVKLFAQRAKRVNLAFSLADELAAVVQICRLVDGLPLAIELAASRVRGLSCAAIAQAISDNLDALAATYQDLPLRHRSLRATFEQSWRLLTADERSVFSRLAVFRGGFQLEAVEQVTGATQEVLAALVDKSLLRRDGTARFDLHELLRQYAAEKLKEAEQIELARNGHLIYFLDLAERAEPQLYAAEQPMWLERLNREHDNLRAALNWAILSQQTELAGRLAGALARFWAMRGYLGEGRQWIAQVLALPGPISTLAREKLLGGAGTLAYRQSDLLVAKNLIAESLALARELNDPIKIACRLQNLAVVATAQGDYPPATTLARECLQIDRAHNNREGVAFDLDILGDIAYRQSDYAQARLHWEESLTLHRQRQDKNSIAICLNNLGEVALHVGDYRSAIAPIEEAIALFREMGNQQLLALVLVNLGQIRAKLGEHTTAVALYREVLQIQVPLKAQADIALTLEMMAELALSIGDPARALHLYGASAALRKTLGAPLTPTQSADRQLYLATARIQLGEAAFESALSIGRTLSIEQAIALAQSTGVPEAANSQT